MTTVTNCPHCGGAVAIMKAPITPAQPSLDTTTKPPQTQPAQKAQAAPLKLVTCNRCDEENLCWQESKNGKFYLCKTGKGPTGEIIPLRKEFHQCSN